MRKRIHEAVMRRLLVVLGLLASISGAAAQEFEIPTLRGTDSFVPDAPGPLYRPRWSGFYVGVQAGYGVAGTDFVTSTNDLVAHMLRNSELEGEQFPSNWSVLGRSQTGSSSWGGFFGYNIGWECLILGTEFNYSRTHFSANSPVFPIERVVSVGGNTDDVTITGSASMHITDYGTVRMRAGYETGNFLPYGFVGLAYGRADLARAASVVVVQTPANGSAPPVTVTFAESDIKNGAFIWGWAVGGGVELMVAPKVFMRGEYEFIAFQQVFGIKSQIQTGRVAIGYKF
jgi:outer membrane immunogenic protein